MRSDFRFWAPVSVRWGDMDARGHVNNAVYFTYCEMARIQYFDAIELFSFREHEDQGPALVSTVCDFRRQLKGPAEIEVGMRVVEIGTRSFRSEYVLYPIESDDVIAEVKAVSVWMDYHEQKAIPLPEGARQAIAALERRPELLGAKPDE